MNNPKEKIKLLVEKYEFAKSAGKIKSYTEEETKKDFILPLFEALGWDVHNKNEVSAEETISSDRVDYGFYLNERAKFYLETKSLKVDLHREEYAKQAIKYSWNKGVTWAVLTDFESVIVFNTQDVKASLASKRLFEISYNEYLERFDQLLLLSRESFEKNLIDTEAEKLGKKFQKVPVTSLLFNDLNECREILTKSLRDWNPKVSAQLLDEGVQKLLDRLIFIRVAEDRGIEKSTLIPLLREWENRKDRNEVPLYKHMVDKFRELDKTYNSNLFTEHSFEKWDEYNDKTKEVIQILYGKPGYYEYDFKAMPADVLGTVYENYLGYKLSQSKKGVEVHKDAKKRKEQGIYYTPHFIVEYIVKNTLGPVLDRCKTIEDIKRIKVLDPACGSGSFLVQALELIYQKYHSMGDRGKLTKYIILTENIYGVDLDEQAVEIARLNLLVSALDGKTKLPSLSHNIKNGNSLISGTDVELKKYFGANFRDKKPFNWEEEFPDVFKQGGFDVIIGNPPYVSSRELNSQDKAHFKISYDSAKDQYDLYSLFMEKGLRLLKNHGYLGFIIPNKFLVTKYGIELRKFIFENASLSAFRDYSHDNVFPDASVYPVVLILNKGKNEKIVPTQKFDLLKEFGFGETDSITAKLDSIKTKLDLDVWRPIATSKNIVDGKKIIISNREINRYSFITDRLGDLNKKRDYDVARDRIIMKKLCYNIEASIDSEGFYPINTTYCVRVRNNEKTDLKFVLAVLNSKLLSFYVRKKYAETALRGGFIELRVFQIKELPVLNIPIKNQLPLIILVDKMLAFQKELHSIEENSNKWEKLKSEIEKTDEKINKEVYKLYGLTPEEIKIVEQQ